jgi:hypothetical protein
MRELSSDWRFAFRFLWAGGLSLFALLVRLRRKGDLVGKVVELVLEYLLDFWVSFVKDLLRVLHFFTLAQIP